MPVLTVIKAASEHDGLIRPVDRVIQVIPNISMGHIGFENPRYFTLGVELEGSVELLFRDARYHVAVNEYQGNDEFLKGMEGFNGDIVSMFISINNGRETLVRQGLHHLTRYIGYYSLYSVGDSDPLLVGETHENFGMVDYIGDLNDFVQYVNNLERRLKARWN